QHARALVGRGQSLLAFALELRGGGVELERLVEIVLVDEGELAQADGGKARGALLRLVRGLPELHLVLVAELLLDHRALREDDALRFEHELAQVRVVGFVDDFLGGGVRLVEHAGEGRAKAVGEQVATLRVKGVVRGGGWHLAGDFTASAQTLSANTATGPAFPLSWTSPNASTAASAASPSRVAPSMSTATFASLVCDSRRALTFTVSPTQV